METETERLIPYIPTDREILNNYGSAEESSVRKIKFSRIYIFMKLYFSRMYN